MIVIDLVTVFIRAAIENPLARCGNTLDAKRPRYDIYTEPFVPIALQFISIDNDGSDSFPAIGIFLVVVSRSARPFDGM